MQNGNIQMNRIVIKNLIQEPFAVISGLPHVIGTTSFEYMQSCAYSTIGNTSEGQQILYTMFGGSENL